MDYSQAIDTLRRHLGHGDALVCLLAQDAAMGRHQPPEPLAAEATAYLFQRVARLEQQGYLDSLSLQAVRDALNWFGRFAADD